MTSGIICHVSAMLILLVAKEITRSIQIVINPNDFNETRENTAKMIKAGVTHLILYIRTPYPENVVRRLVDEVVEPLKAKYE
jgi:hypothetical protein